MGQVPTSTKITYQIEIKTGDKLFSGTDANVYMKLYCNDGQSSNEILLDSIFRDDLELGKTDVFKHKRQTNLPSVDFIEIWRTDSDVVDNWYVEYIRVTNKSTAVEFLFPLFRWIKAGSRYRILHLDTNLPQTEPYKDTRKIELDEKKQMYELSINIANGPAQIKVMPTDEIFSFDYTSAKTWRKDTSFGNQRIASLNNSSIELCSEIPDKLRVTNQMLAPFLEGYTLEQVIKAKRLFKVDHNILAGIPCREGFSTCVPIALFFVNNNFELVPIAIQLFQDGSDNTVFLPDDPPYVWMMAKMWFNNADANVHQSLTHLGYTHLLMEGATVVTHRNLSPSHPLFKLLAPHFLYLIAINTRALNTLVKPGGYVDQTMNIGANGMFEIMRRGIKRWRMDVEGTLPEDLRKRGVLDHNVLPGYHFRDDAMLLYNAINKYVRKYVDLYYSKLTGDWELQSWGAELVKARVDGGCGLLGVPGNGNFSSKDHLYITLTSIIYQCSVAHAATNFPQYDEYAFVPNYPAFLRGTPSKDKTPRTEGDILKMLPDKPTTLEIMKITKILSQHGTNSLGDFEVQYIFEPEARKVVDEFRADLAEISKTIKEKNKVRNPPYPFLDPEGVPNSISI